MKKNIWISITGFKVLIFAIDILFCILVKDVYKGDISDQIFKSIFITNGIILGIVFSIWALFKSISIINAGMNSVYNDIKLYIMENNKNKILEDLKSQLLEAIENEEYEKATNIRKKLERMKKR